MASVSTSRCRERGGFTLIELLAVIAVLGILFALWIPAIGGARVQVAKNRTRAQFAQYVMACEQFRAERGYYPAFGVDEPELSLRERMPVFVETLSGRGFDGIQRRETYALQANPQGTVFHRFAASDFAPEGDRHAGQLVDALGNPNLYMVVDADLDGFIEADDFRVLPAERRPGRLRAGVLFYSANPENRSEWEWILSWE